MVGITVLMLNAVLIALDAFPFWLIVDVVVVVRIVHYFVPIECLADGVRHDSAPPHFHALSEAERGQVKLLIVSVLTYWFL